MHDGVEGAGRERGRYPRMSRADGTEGAGQGHGHGCPPVLLVHGKQAKDGRARAHGRACRAEDDAGHAHDCVLTARAARLSHKRCMRAATVVEPKKRRPFFFTSHTVAQSAMSTLRSRLLVVRQGHNS